MSRRLEEPDEAGGLDAGQVLVEVEAVHVVLEAQLLEPLAMTTSPVAALPVDKTSTQQHLAQTVASPEQVLLQIFPATAQIPQRLLLLARRMDLDQQTRFVRTLHTRFPSRLNLRIQRETEAFVGGTVHSRASLPPPLKKHTAMSF